MRERERIAKPGGADRPNPKPSSRPAPPLRAPRTRTKPAPGTTKDAAAAKPAPKPPSTAAKTSSSSPKSTTKASSSRTPGSTSRTPGSTSRTPGSTSRTPGSSSRTPGSTSSRTPGSTSSRTPGSTSSRTPGSTSRTPASSSSKAPATKSSSRSSSNPTSSSSRGPKASSSSSSSRTRSSSKPDEKLSTSNARSSRTSSKDVSSRRSSVSSSPSKADRESSRRDKLSSKSSSSSRATKPDRDSKREEKGSTDRKLKEKSSSDRKVKDGTSSSDRRLKDRTSSSKSEKDVSNREHRSKRDTETTEEKRESRSKHSLEEKELSDKEKPIKDKEEKRERIKSARHDRVKSSKHREKISSNEEDFSKHEPTESPDSGVDGINIAPVISQNAGGPGVEAVEQYQNSLETMESGISLSSPRDLSEAELEESISSKMVEVDEMQETDLGDEDEAMIDNEKTFPDSKLEDGSQPVSFDMQSGNVDVDVNQEEDDYDDYEEDFEDYESDFEDDDGDEDGDDNDSEAEDSTSEDSEEEEDSDVSEPDPFMVDVLKAIQEENDFDSRLQRTYSIDEPDKDDLPTPRENHKVEPVLETYPIAKPAEATASRPKTSRTFVNFAVAQKKQAAAHISSRMNTRGRRLLDMIQLDTVTVDLLTLSPVSYEAYISSFGHSNRQQVSIQTNEDALSEEVQTDEIQLRDKWTQKPVYISIGKDEKMPGPEDYLGVGGDMDPIKFSANSSSNTGRLTSFLTAASQVMLTLLEEELVWELESSNKTNDVSTTSDGLGFSHPPVPMGSNVQSLLEGRPTPFVQFCASEPTMLLSCHGFRDLEQESKEYEGEEEEEQVNINELNDSSLLCVWWVQEPSRPQQLLSCRSMPTAATFSPVRPSLVLAGLEDGSLAAWDLREPLSLHNQQTKINDVMWKVRVPSFVTACNEIGDGEESKIVAIQAVTSQEDQEVNNNGAFQIVTLSSDGRVTWWVVVRVPHVDAVSDILGGRKANINISNKAVVSPQLGAAPWSRIALNRAATINIATTLYGDEALSDSILCHDLRLNPGDPSRLYIATVSGAVAHCSRHSSRLHPRAYLPEIEPGCEALCLAVCPHDNRYILVGSSDGVVRLHSSGTERPLTSWQSSTESVPVIDLQWSPARPCVFYVLDANARLHVWDLSAGDIFPVLTVEAGGLVGGDLSSFHIASTKATSRHPLHAVFANDQGELVLRQVSPEFSTHQVIEDYNTELERFTYYVNII